MRIIDGDAFVDKFSHIPMVQDALRKAVDSMPTVDAVPVVRCKDCESFSHGYCRFHDAKFVRPNGYCYWGGQKEGERQ